MSEDPDQEFVVGEMYGTRHPRNQIPNEDDFAFVVRGIDKSSNEIDVEFLMLNGKVENLDRTEDTISYAQYYDSLQNNTSPFGHLEQ